MILAALVAVVHGAAPCTAPPARQAAIVRELIAAVNSGQPQILSAFVARRWSRADTTFQPMRRVLPQLGLEHWKSRSWRLLEICRGAPTSLSVLAHNALSEETDSLTLILDTAGKPSRLIVTTGVRVPITAGDTLSDSARVAALRAYLARLRGHGLFPGAVVIRDSGGFEFSDSAGMERMDGREAIGTQTRMNIASAGKLLTAVSVMQLAAGGRLSLDDSLDKLLPDSLSPALSGVRVRQLLSHTSGIRNSRTELASAPGAAYSYSNLGFVILGEVVERCRTTVGSTTRFDGALRASGVFRRGRLDGVGRRLVVTRAGSRYSMTPGSSRASGPPPNPQPRHRNPTRSRRV